MKNNLFILLLMLSAQQAFAQTCRDNIPASTPDTRFEINGDEVTDTDTGLIWQRCSLGQTGHDCRGGSANIYSWQQALQEANGTWRLPNVYELRSIVEERCHEPAINLALFPNTPNTGTANYWSASPYVPPFSINAWYVNFGYGDSRRGSKGDDHYVRLVRSGQ